MEELKITRERAIRRMEWILKHEIYCSDKLSHAAINMAITALRSTAPENKPLTWIPTSKRTPKVWRRENGEPIEFNVMLLGAKEATTLCFNGSQWFEFDWTNMRIAGYYTVTHWMPLPQPPEARKPERSDEP